MPPKKKDPAEGIPGFEWRCTNCSSSKPWLIRCLKMVNGYMDHSQMLASLPKKATVYCPNCPEGKRLYCTECAGRLHCVSTVNQHHSLEAIDPNQTAVRRYFFFLPPLFDFLLLPSVTLFVVLSVGIPSDYLTGRDICPVTHTVRRGVYHFDTGLMYFYKAGFAWVCNLEDGYFRLFFDAWVRGIKTDSDSLLLLASAIVRSILFHTVVIRLFIFPFLVFLNTVCSNGFYLAVTLITRFFPDGLPITLPPRLQDFVTRARNASNVASEYLNMAICKATSNKGADYEDRISKLPSILTGILLNPATLPPPTTPRVRPRTDYLDAISYWSERKVRMTKYFQGAAYARLRVLTVAGPVLAVLIRLLCMATSFDWFVRVLVLRTGDVAKFNSDVPYDVIGHTVDKIVRAMLGRFVPMALIHIPVAGILCFWIIFFIILYPYFKYYIDTRNWYGDQCAVAPKKEFKGVARWFPHTFDQ